MCSTLMFSQIPILTSNVSASHLYINTAPPQLLPSRSYHFLLPLLFFLFPRVRVILSSPPFLLCFPWLSKMLRTACRKMPLLRCLFLPWSRNSWWKLPKRMTPFPSTSLRLAQRKLPVRSTLSAKQTTSFLSFSPLNSKSLAPPFSSLTSLMTPLHR